MNLFFYSRVLKGKHNNTFNHQLFDVKESEYDNIFFFFEDFNMNGNLIKNLGDPTNETDAVNKNMLIQLKPIMKVLFFIMEANQ